MLFNSYEYILVFLPVTVLVFLALGRNSRPLALGWLILASVVFYAWWRPVNLAIIAPSIALNYVLGRALLGMAGDPARARRRTALLVARHRLQRLLPRLLQVRELRGHGLRRHDRRRLRLEERHPAARHLVHHLPEDRLPDRRRRRADQGLQPARLPALRDVLPAAHRRADRPLHRDHAAVGSAPPAASTRRSSPSASRSSASGSSRRWCSPTAWPRTSPRSSPGPPPAPRRPSCSRGWRRSASPCRSTSTSRATPTWPAGRRCSSASACRSTSTRR